VENGKPPRPNGAGSLVLFLVAVVVLIGAVWLLMYATAHDLSTWFGARDSWRLP
jgi:hypothetical protein